MIRRLTTAACALALAGCFSNDLRRSDARMDRNKLQIGVYCLAPYARTEAHVKAVKDCGVDFIYGVPAQDRVTLDLCAKYSLGVIATGAVPFWHGMGGQQAGQMRQLRPFNTYFEAMNKFEDHPAIWMLDYIDEPSALDFPYIGEVGRLMDAMAPKGVYSYINLYPNYASVVGNSAEQSCNQLGTATYREHVNAYARELANDYVCFDFYLYSTAPKNRAEKLQKFYDNFDELSEMCHRTGRSLWFIPQVNSSFPEEWTSVNRLRFQAYLAMAYGTEQIDWACWSRAAGGETEDMPGLTGWWTNNVLTLKGEITEQYDKLKTVNAELHRLGPTYMKYRNVATRRGSVFTVGEMVSRSGSGKATFVLAADDPFDEHSAVHDYVFESSETVKVLGKDGAIAIRRVGPNRWAFTLRSNECALIEEL